MIFHLTAFFNSVTCKVAALLLLSIATILLFNLHEKYTVSGPELLNNASFDNNLAGWVHTPHGISTSDPAVGGVRLHSEIPATSIQITQIIPDAKPYPLLRLSCDIKTHNVAEGKARWMTARVLLVSHDLKENPMYHLPHTLINLSGTHNWEHHEAVFPIDANATSISVSVQLAQATGTMWVKNISLRPVTQMDSFYTLRITAALLWVVVILWIAAPLTRWALGNIQSATVIALAVIIALGTLMPVALKVYISSSLFPGDLNSELHVAFSDVAFFKFTPLLPTPDIFKAGHFILFAMLAAAAFSRRTFPASRSGLLAFLLLFALVTEVLQLFVGGRGAQLGDLVIDSAGIATGLMLLWLARLFLPPHD
jgi:VanZ family protein